MEERWNKKDCMVQDIFERKKDGMVWMGRPGHILKKKGAHDMEGVIAGFLETAVHFRRTVVENTHDQLLAEIEAVKSRLECVSARFDQQSDPDLLEECIYEMQALTARYRYLTREARRKGVTRHLAASLQQL